MADTNLIALALAHSFFQSPSQETDIAQLLAYEDEKDEGIRGNYHHCRNCGLHFSKAWTDGLSSLRSMAFLRRAGRSKGNTATDFISIRTG